METPATLIESLAHCDTYQNYASAFSESTGLPISLRTIETWHLPLQGRPHENRFCALMSEQSRSCAACFHLQERLTNGAMETPSCQTCTYGLTEAAVPIRLGTKTIGFIQTGQVLQQPPTEALFAEATQNGRKLGVDIGSSRNREAFFQTPVVPPHKLESITNLLGIFADHLAMKSNQIAIQAANAEPPVITKAKDYIQVHHMEPLSLGQVAASANTSLFYFCKLFKRVTGINFTEYVSRVRVEKAKNLLLNPNLRVTEIAYEVGFQSLTHFNRVFKRIAGESPSDYRGHLPRSA